MPAALKTDQTLHTIRRIPATIAAIGTVRAEIADALAERAWGPAETMGVVLAASEGMVNAVEHGSRDGGHVTVSYEIHADRAEVTIADDGRPGDRDRERAADDTRGRGMMLINGLATRLQYAWNGSGTVLSMVFEREPAAAT
jgi:anti-sigma regulatory factor (Ser/Thr protein kinase)